MGCAGRTWEWSPGNPMSVGSPVQPQPLHTDFSDRLERSLRAADAERRRRIWLRRARRVFLVALLIGPVLGWRLMLSTPDGVHVSIAALAWLTFVIDVAVHLDTGLLSYLGLAELPTIVGALLMLLLTVSLLSEPRQPK